MVIKMKLNNKLKVSAIESVPFIPGPIDVPNTDNAIDEENLEFNPEFLKEMKEIENNNYITVTKFKDLFNDE